MSTKLEPLKSLLRDFRLFAFELFAFLVKVSHLQFIRFESGKSVFVTALYRQRGRLARRLMHSGMAGITAFGVMMAPIVAQQFPEDQVDPWEVPTTPAVLSAATENPATSTDLADSQTRAKIIEYTVEDGDTVSSIAAKFGISENTIRWQNAMKNDTIKPGQVLEILPVSGISHKVSKGDSIESIAKKYDIHSQEIADFPFNSFVNDETFELAIGQTVIVPNGIKPADKTTAPVRRDTRQVTPDAGTVIASGTFIWPSTGGISQYYSWYHKAVDIANRAAPQVVAADSGTVVTSGWSNVGYGYHVVIDHGNGTRTLYAHMQRLYVSAGQRVARGNAIGQMGSTGRSTGIHLHFEVIRNGVYLNPLSVLQ